MKPFARRLAWITGIALVIRLTWAVSRRNTRIGGDAFFYHYGANLLLHGKGFIAPFQYYAYHGLRVQAADHPPLYLLFLALPSVFGIGSPLVHLVWSALCGTATVVVIGLLGRRVGGDRVGLIAAGLAAVYPNVWVYDGQLLSETLAIFVVTLALLLAYRAWEKPTLGRYCALGAACGAAALTRSELALLVPALVLPLALTSGGQTRARWERVGVGAAIALLVVTPWVAYNMTRFQHPVYLSSQLEPTLAGANCGDTYYGSRIGLTTYTCITGVTPIEDQSVTDRVLGKQVRTFIRGHLSRVPLVVAARVARVTGLYAPRAQLDVDVVLEGRPRPLAITGLLSAYAIDILAIAGIVLWRRQRSDRMGEERGADQSTWRRRRSDGVPLWPLLVLPALALVTVAATYGTNRFRATAETSLLVLAAVAIDHLSPGRTRVGSEPVGASE
jgi:4-amino-4-deoxy-L-arabinose transferase-like glycosyltransferase